MAVLARILLRYGAGALVAWGLLTADLGAMLSTDPEVITYTQFAIGVVAAGVAEGWYWLAKKFGWGT